MSEFVDLVKRVLNEIGDTNRGQLTLKSYIKKAMKSYTHHDSAFNRMHDMGTDAANDRKVIPTNFSKRRVSDTSFDALLHHNTKTRNRFTGVVRAGKKLKHFKEESFGSAFKAARASGKSTFDFGGKSFTTRQAGETDSGWKSNLKPTAATSAPVPLPRPRPNMTKVASRPDAPVGQMPRARTQTTVTGRPDAPIGKLPSAKSNNSLNSYVKNPPRAFSPSAYGAAQRVAAQTPLSTALAAKAASMRTKTTAAVREEHLQELSNVLIDRYRRKANDSLGDITTHIFGKDSEAKSKAITKEKTREAGLRTADAKLGVAGAAKIAGKD